MIHRNDSINEFRCRGKLTKKYLFKPFIMYFWYYFTSEKNFCISYFNGVIIHLTFLPVTYLDYDSEPKVFLVYQNETKYDFPRSDWQMTATQIDKRNFNIRSFVRNI